MDNGFHRLGDIRRRMSNGVPSGYRGEHGFLILRRMESSGEGGNLSSSQGHSSPAPSPT